MGLKQYLRRTRTDAEPNDTDRGDDVTSGHKPREKDSLERRARYMAEQICSGFQLHDRRQRQEALEAFYVVDRNQFAHLDSEEARRASEGYVDALWEKDTLEKSYITDQGIDPQRIANGEWDQVQSPLEERAEIVGMDRRYATKTTEAWLKHKTEEDYWTPFLEAQTYEIRAALQDQTYPNKPKEGKSGYGSIATRYLLSVELHDMHTQATWEEAIRVMVPYYRTILRSHSNRSGV